MMDMAGVMPMPDATSTRLSYSAAVAYGEANGPEIHTGRRVGRWTTSCRRRVQSPPTAMHTHEWWGLVGCEKSEKACHSNLESHGKQTST